MLIKKIKERAAAEERFRQEVLEQLRQLSQSRTAAEEGLSSLQEEIKHIRGDLSRQNMALEDCLEALDSQEEEQENIRRQKRTMEQEKEKLLELIFLYQQQMWSMKAFALENGSPWLEQLSLSEKAVREKMRSCGIIPLGEPGETIDFDLHDVVKTVETEDEGLDRKVACVYRPGYLYQGTVGRKAQVAAYRADLTAAGK